MSRRLVAGLAAAALLVGSLAACAPSAERSAALPQVTLAGFDGGPDVDLGELDGPALINLWASWCTPCRAEMPLLEEFHQRRPDVRVLGVDHDDPHLAEARALVRDTGVTYELAVDPEAELSGLAPFPIIRGLPWSGVVDENGDLVHGAFVEFTSVAQVEAFVDDALAGADGAP